MRRWLVPFVVVVIAAALGSVAVVLLTGGDDSHAATLVLEPVNTTGTDPFTDSVAIRESATLPASVSTSSVRLDADAQTGGLTASGSSPGLYGGSRNETVCDPGQLVTFLEQNPGKAAAWAEVLGIRTQNIKSYVAGLTPVVLTTDTRVTNHGYSNGHATTLQSVLQAGTAVLVDARGVPRVKCGCGNPLTEPGTLTVAPAESPWPGYQSDRLTVITPAAQPVTNLTLIDITTGATYQQPTGAGDGTSKGGTGAIHDVDFLNRTYRTHQPEESDIESAECSFGDVTLVGGRSGGGELGAESSEAKVTYADVTGDGRDEALVALQYSAGAGLHYTNNMVFGMRGGEVTEIGCVPGDVATVLENSSGVVGWTAQSNGSISRVDAVEYQKVTITYRESEGKLVVASNDLVPVAQFHAETGQ